MNDNAIKITGLLPTIKDSRNYQLGDIVQLPSLEELPDSFSLTPLSVKNQIDDFCTAAATVGMSELQEKVELSWRYSMALSKELSGNPNQWGQDLPTAMKTHQKLGALELTDSPLEGNYDSNFLRDIDNWPVELKEKIANHRKEAYAEISGPYDAFDNIRASIWKFKDEERAVGLGLTWSWPLSIPLIDKVQSGGSGHMVYTIGWKDKDYLIIQNSYGIKNGDKGKFYIHRDVINHYFDIFSAFMFIDMKPEDVKELIENELKIEDNMLYKWLVIFKNFIRSIFKR